MSDNFNDMMSGLENPAMFLVEVIPNNSLDLEIANRALEHRPSSAVAHHNS
jgi:hypothetical protein